MIDYLFFQYNEADIDLGLIFDGLKLHEALGFAFVLQSLKSSVDEVTYLKLIKHLTSIRR